jgi:hypothetical protein
MISECPDTENLVRFLEHKVSPGEMTALLAHFVECRTCREIIAHVIKGESTMTDSVLPKKATSLS